MSFEPISMVDQCNDDIGLVDFFLVSAEWNGRQVSKKDQTAELSLPKLATLLNNENSCTTAMVSNDVNGSASIEGKADTDGNASIRGEVGVTSRDSDTGGSIGGSVGGSVERDKDGNTRGEAHAELNIGF